MTVQRRPAARAVPGSLMGRANQSDHWGFPRSDMTALPEREVMQWGKIATILAATTATATSARTQHVMAGAQAIASVLPPDKPPARPRCTALS